MHGVCRLAPGHVARLGTSADRLVLCHDDGAYLKAIARP